MPPFMAGGDMIESVSFAETTYASAPQKFEAGTPDIASVIGLGAAIDYVQGLGMERISAWEHELMDYASKALAAIPELRILGTARRKCAVLSFVLEGIHPHDIATVLDGEGIAVRAGHHCAQPVMERYGVSSTTRASFCFYNTREEVDRLVLAIRKVLELFD
jgi:cysteine desulfurase/selenocysteine lyase